MASGPSLSLLLRFLELTDGAEAVNKCVKWVQSEKRVMCFLSCQEFILSEDYNKMTPARSYQGELGAYNNLLMSVGL